MLWDWYWGSSIKVWWNSWRDQRIRETDQAVDQRDYDEIEWQD